MDSGENQQITKSSNRSIPTPHSPLPHPFVIRTPTATVTDLGTEFGVEVDRRALPNRTSSAVRSK